MEFDLSDYAAAIRAIGPEHCILASDLGQIVNPPYPKGLVEFFAGLRWDGFSDAAIAYMSKENPGPLLRLSTDEWPPRCARNRKSRYPARPRHGPDERRRTTSRNRG